MCCTGRSVRRGTLPNTRPRDCHAAPTGNRPNGAAAADIPAARHRSSRTQPDPCGDSEVATRADLDLNDAARRRYRVMLRVIDKHDTVCRPPRVGSI